MHNPKHRRNRSQTGFSLLEFLIVMAILVAIIGPVLGIITMLNHTVMVLASQKSISERRRYLISDLRETLAGAGTATKNLAEDRLIVRNTETKKPCPAAFLDEKGEKLTVVVTDQTGAASIVSKTGNSLILDRAAFNRWMEVRPYSYAMAINPIGSPAIIQITSAPRKAAETDIPADSGTYNLEQCTVVQVAPAGELLGVQSLSTTVGDDATIIPITRIVRYSMVESWVQRDELDASGTPSLGPRPTERTFIAMMTPGLTSKINFAYLTTTGRTTELPSDLKTLRGIRVQTTLTDPSTQFKEDDGYDLFVKAWQ